MNYSTQGMKLDQFINYINEGKINLIPPFQRGHVWTLSTRRKLIQNVVQGRPIPAIFLYREQAGDKYSYNILDGKQRLESLILFVGNQRNSFKINEIASFFFDTKVRALANFQIDIGGKRKQGLKDLDDSLLREFREYIIPTIEITLSDEHQAPLDEIISLFVDINQYGVQVKRFDIVKAMSKDALLKSVFGLLALKQNRGKDVFYRAKSNEFTKTLKNLQVVEKITDANAQVDRMWELLVELFLFQRSGKHRTPVEILKSFIRTTESIEEKVTKAEVSVIRKVFALLLEAQKNASFKKSRAAKNQIHFYTIVTAIISEDLMDQYSKSTLTKKLVRFGKLLDETEAIPKSLAKTFDTYSDLTAKHTTHPGRREDRQREFVKLIKSL